MLALQHNRTWTLNSTREEWVIFVNIYFHLNDFFVCQPAQCWISLGDSCCCKLLCQINFWLFCSHAKIKIYMVKLGETSRTQNKSGKMNWTSTWVGVNRSLMRKGLKFMNFYLKRQSDECHKKCLIYSIYLTHKKNIPSKYDLLTAKFSTFR